MSESDRQYEEGAGGTEVGRKDDPLKESRSKEPMTPAKIKEHEPTAVKQDWQPLCSVRLIAVLDAF